MSRARLVVLAPPELENGFLLAGVEVETTEDAGDAGARLDSLLSEGPLGVIAVYAPFLDALPLARRERLERSVMPVVVPFPTGLGQSAADHRARLMARLQRAIGFRVTFGEDAHG